MFRRLHFLLPNAKQAQSVVEELLDMGVNSNQIHTHAEHNMPTGSLRPATENQKQDRARHLENVFWNTNLAMFFILMIVMLFALFNSFYLLALGCVAVMMVNFAIGNFFASHIPHMHLDQFKNALSHNELLLMVDIPDDKVAIIEDRIHRHHPAAVEGGSSWAFKGIDL